MRWIASAAFLLLTGASSQAQTFHYVDGLDPNGYNRLALRVGPSYQAPWSPTKMPSGTLLTVLDRYGEWYQVQVQSSRGIGWANARYVACCRTMR